MKTYIDLQETYKNLFLGSKRLKNRFKRYWGTTVVDGVEVFNKRLQVWPGTDNKNVVKILKMFGAYNSIKSASFEGITSYYLWLNPGKAGGLVGITADIWVNKINALIPNGVDFSVVINYTDVNDPMKFVGWTKEQISTYIESNYTSILSSMNVECRGDTVAQEAFGLYMPLDGDVNFKMDVTEATTTPIAYGAIVNGVTTYRTGVSVTYKVRQISPLQETDAMAVAILNETDINRVNKLKVALDLDDDTPTVNANAWIRRNTGVTNELWYKGYLRVAVTDSSYVSRNKFAEILATCIDTGYTKKKTKWWKKLLAIVVVVIAVVISWGAAGAAAAIGTTAWLGSFALYLGVSVLVLTGIQYALAKNGDIGFAQYLGRLVQIVGIVSMIAGVASFVQNFAKEAAKNAIMEALKEGAYTKALQLSGEAAVAVAKNALTDLTSKATAIADNVSIGNVLELLGSKISTIGMKVASTFMDMRINTAREDLRDAEELVQQSRKELMELTDREINIGVEDIKYYTQPLKVDNLVFEVDYLYEGTKYNIGRPSFYPTGLNLRDG